MQTSRFSIVVALYNQPEYTQLFLQSIRENSTNRCEIIAIDNGSSAPGRSWIKNQNIDNLILWDTNEGTTKAWNAGIRAANNEYICIFNNDAVVGPRWQEGLLEVLDNAPRDLGSLSPSTNGITYNLEITSDNDGVKRFAQEAKYLQSQPASLWKFSLIGSGIVLPRRTIEKIGLFDERFFAYYNDLDYSLSITAMGLVAYTTSKSTMYHFGGKSANDAANIKKEHDRIKFLDKWKQTHDFLNQYFSILSNA